MKPTRPFDLLLLISILVAAPFQAGSSYGADPGRVGPRVIQTTTHAGQTLSPDTDNPAGLVSWWRAEDNAADELGNNPGMERAGVSYTDGIVGRAFRFAGTGYIEVNSSVSLEPAAVTVMAWIRGGPPDYPGTYMLSKGAYECNGNSAYAIYTRPGAPIFYCSDGPLLAESPRAVSEALDGRWHHVAGTFDGSFVRLYVDGVEQGRARQARVSTIDYATPDNLAFYIGAYFSSCNSYIFNGDMDEVRVFSRALTGDEINAVYTREQYVAQLQWDEPGAETLAPPQNLTARIVSSYTEAVPGSRSRDGERPSSRAAIVKDSAITGYNVYRSTSPNTPPSPDTFFTSVPPSQTTTTAPVDSSGSFFVITATYGSGESDPSNTAGAGGPGASISRLRVKPAKVVARGTGFTDTVVVFVDGIPFTTPALVDNQTKVTQVAMLLTGTELRRYLKTRRTIEFAFLNSDQTITRVPYSVGGRGGVRRAGPSSARWRQAMADPSGRLPQRLCRRSTTAP